MNEASGAELTAAESWPLECEAERRILQCVFLIEQAFGSGRIDLAEMKDVLVGRNTEQCESAHP
jgi:hypothetical protein